MSGRLDGKTAIVTGASEGIGAAIARRFHAEGACQVLVARSAERGEALAAELGPRSRFLAADVTDPQTPAAALAAAAELGEVDVLVNNAGIDFTGELLSTREEDVRRVMDVNFHGALQMLVAVAAEMRGRGRGSIVNVTSRLASIGVPEMAVYAASKGALLSLTRAAAVELAPLGIRVNAVAPGLTETPLIEAWVAQQSDSGRFRAELRAQVPQGRLGAPEDVAAAVTFLAADESSHVTGASIPVDGGYTAK